MKLSFFLRFYLRIMILFFFLALIYSCKKNDTRILEKSNWISFDNSVFLSFTSQNIGYAHFDNTKRWPNRYAYGLYGFSLDTGKNKVELLGDSITIGHKHYAYTIFRYFNQPIFKIFNNAKDIPNNSIYFLLNKSSYKNKDRLETDKNIIISGYQLAEVINIQKGTEIESAISGAFSFEDEWTDTYSVSETDTEFILDINNQNVLTSICIVSSSKDSLNAILKSVEIQTGIQLNKINKNSTEKTYDITYINNRYRITVLGLLKEEKALFDFDCDFAIVIDDIDAQCISELYYIKQNVY